jgi:transposase
MVQRLRLYWIHQFYMADDGQVTWRSAADLPPAALRPHTPYDADARYGNKRSTSWQGYKVHLTETCDAGAARFIVHVATTPATVPDLAMAVPLHEALEDRGVLPSRHLLDAGYVDAGIRVRLKRDFQVEPVSPVRPNSNWQSRTQQGYSLEAFAIDWENRRARCPEGHLSTTWRPNKDMWGGDVIQIAFGHATCRRCPSRSACTQSPTQSRRITVRPQAEHEAIQQAHRAQETDAWKVDYARRAGIEGTLSQGIRAFDLRRCRYLGLAKASLQEILAATAMNMVRAYYWLTDRPVAKTRQSPFAAMYKPAA